MKDNMILRSIFILMFFALTLPAMGQNKQNKNTKSKSPSITWINQPKSTTTLPANTKHLKFFSKLVNHEIGYCIYLPPSYVKALEEIKPTLARYPVIYNLHGNGGNEFTSLDSIAVLHEGILAKRWPEVIVVLPNGGHNTFYKDSANGKFPIESIFIKELIPHIDKTFSTVANRTGRCIEGFSMGGRGSTRLAMKYPEMFCSLFCQAGNVPHLIEIFDNAEPLSRKSLLLGEERSHWEANDVYKVTTKNAKRIKNNVRIQIICGTQDTAHIKTIRDFHQHLQELNIDHTYIEIEGLGHRRSEMIKRLKPIWFDYHIESLRLAKTL